MVGLVLSLFAVELTETLMPDRAVAAATIRRAMRSSPRSG
jgi:hypothetical protein